MVKIRQRDISVAGTLLIAASARGAKDIKKVLDNYLDVVYTDSEQRKERYDAMLWKELELMNKVDWKSVLKVPDHVKKELKHRPQVTKPSKEGQMLDEILE